MIFAISRLLILLSLGSYGLLGIFRYLSRVRAQRLYKGAPDAEDKVKDFLHRYRWHRRIGAVAVPFGLFLLTFIIA